MLLFVNKRQISECLNLSSATLKKYRLQGDWIEGIHWVRINSRCIRHTLKLIKDWLSNRNHLVAHQRSIAAYEAILLSRGKLSEKKSVKSSS
jgi:hypothetical protein